MSAQPVDQAAKAGHDTAVSTIIRQADAGMTAEQIAGQQHDHSAWLLSETTTADGQSFAEAYDNAAQALAAELIAAERERTAAPLACHLMPGTPHVDPALAAKGWQSNGRVYVRREPVADREAG